MAPDHMLHVADMGMKPSVRFSTACALAELWLERGEVEVAAQLLRDIERMAPQDNPPAAAQYVKLLQRAGCQARPALLYVQRPCCRRCSLLTRFHCSCGHSADAVSWALLQLSPQGNSLAWYDRWGSAAAPALLSVSCWEPCVVM